MKEYTGKSLDEILNEIATSQECRVEDITYNLLEENKHLFGIGNSVTIEAYTPKDVKEFIFNFVVGIEPCFNIFKFGNCSIGVVLIVTDNFQSRT